MKISAFILVARAIASGHVTTDAIKAHTGLTRRPTQNGIAYLRECGYATSTGRRQHMQAVYALTVPLELIERQGITTRTTADALLEAWPASGPAQRKPSAARVVSPLGAWE